MEPPIVSARARRRTALLAVALCALASVVAGCGALGYTSAKADKANGKKLFSAKCGSCHTLADAGTAGNIGPDLDYAFKQDLAVGMTEGTIRQVVRAQIAYAITETSTGAPGMPKNLVTGSDAKDVAAYVASVAGRDVAAVAAPAPGPAPAPASASTSTTTAAGGSSSGAGDVAAIAMGKQAFAANGCGGCHTLKAAGSGGNVGPNLDKLATDAKTAGQLLDAYVRESIVKPNAYIVKGFSPNVMPGTFGQTLTAPQLNGLIAYLLAVSGK